MRIVQKYGGSSLANVERLRAAAQRISQLARQGVQVIVVVSAQGDTTDDLIDKAKEINPFNNAPVLNVEARYNSFSNHFATSMASFRSIAPV